MAERAGLIAVAACLALCACGGSGGRKLPDFAVWADASAIDAVEAITDAGEPEPEVATDPGPLMVSARCFPDSDQDGYPVKGGSVEVEEPSGACPKGYTFLLTFANGLLLDCDDAVFTTHPGAPEICNLVDDDCDGLTDEGLDQPCTDNCGNQGQSLCEDGVWTPCSAGGKVCCEGERKEIIPCPPFDFVFVTDYSGSMTQSDPGDIRYKAVEVFIEDMDNDEGLIIGFNHVAKHYGYFTGDKELLKAFLAQAKAEGPEGATDIDGALYLAFSMFLDPGERDVVILLTDGHDTTNPELFDPAALKKAATDLGIRVFILGLGQFVNEPALKATVTDDGGYYFAGKAEEILKIYDNIFAVTNYEHWLQCNDTGDWVEMWGDCGD